MTMQELKAKAKELGINSFGMKKDELEKTIEKKSKEPVSVLSNEESKEKQSKDFDSAVVYNGKHLVRVYSKAQHGEDFAELAQKFVSSPARSNYRVEFAKAKKVTVCPSCGFKF